MIKEVSRGLFIIDRRSPPKETELAMSQTVIVYHHNCHDGITALWAASQAYPSAEHYPGRHSEGPDLQLLAGKEVVMVDFCWSYDQTLELC